ncbi:MAG: hypothetical protein SNJ70_01160 [Armatimonadota bacterium]
MKENKKENKIKLPKDTTKVAWHGIQVTVPEDWSLIGMQGTLEKGYYRVDGPVASALEIRWSDSMGKRPDAAVKVRQLLDRTEKENKKLNKKFSSETNEISSDDVRYSWVCEDRVGNGRALYCEKCDRMIMAQIISSRNDWHKEYAYEILESINDHREDNLINWGLLGFEFAVPEGFQLFKQVTLSGYLSLWFKKQSKILVVERWGLASSLKGNTSLEDWYRADVLNDIKGYRVNIESNRFREHEALKITGRAYGVMQTLKAIGKSFTLYPHPVLLTGYAWYCEESNRLYAVRGLHVEEDDFVELVRDSIPCG